MIQKWKSHIYHMCVMISIILLLTGCNADNGDQKQALDIESNAVNDYVDVSEVQDNSKENLDKYTTADTKEINSQSETDDQKDFTQNSNNDSNRLKTDKSSQNKPDVDDTDKSITDNSDPTEDETAKDKLAEGNPDTNKGNTTTDPNKDEPNNKITDEPEPIESTENTCTLYVECTTALNHLDYMTKEKASIMPADGIVYAKKVIEIQNGDTVFSILQREMQNNRIQMDFNYTAVYDSNYIKGINNLYEFDCGELSGWMYCVNGSYPNYGCSQYTVSDGDVIEFHYTCDLGRDL